MTFIEQWQDQLPDSLFNFAKLEPEAGDIDFGSGLLAAAVLWPIRQALRKGDEEAIHALGQIVGLNQVDLVLQAVEGWENDLLEAARSLSVRAADDPRLDQALTALREYFNAPALFAEQAAQAASQRIYEEEPPERYTPHPAEFEALTAAVVAGQAPETIRLPLDEIDEEDELAARIKDLLYRVIKTYFDQVKTSADGPQPADDPVLRRLEKAFAESAYLLRGCETENDLLATLVSRLAHLPELVPLTDVLSQRLRPPYLALRHPPTDLAHPALVHILDGHDAPVSRCAVSADGGTVVSLDWHDALKVWDARHGLERLTLAGHSDRVRDCAISGDGSVVVSASDDKTLKIWDARSGAELMTLAGHADGVHKCAISADGATIVSASGDNTLKVWDARVGRQRHSLSSSGAGDCAISADGSMVVSTCDDKTLRVWDARSGAELMTLAGHTDRVHRCAMSADGATLLSGSRDHTLKVWDGHTGAERLTIQHPGPIDDCALSADGSTIVSATSDETAAALVYLDGGYYNLLMIWDARTGAERLTLTGHTSLIWSCAISADGGYVVSAAGDLLSMAFDHTVRVWDLHEDARPLLPARQTASAFLCDISADGAVAISYSFEGGLTVWDPQSMAERYTLPGRWESALSADGGTLISRDRDKSLKVWDAWDGTQRATLAGQGGSIVGCAISADGGTMISEDRDGTLKIWDTRSGRERFTLSGHDSPLRRCAISADGAVAVSASQDSEIKVWDTHTGAERLTIAMESGELGDCAVSPDGALICAASTDFDHWPFIQEFKVWDAHTGVERFSLTGHEWEIRGCAFSHDGGLIVSAARDGILKVWDAESGACLTTLGGLGPLYGCACSSYGQHIMAVGRDGVCFLRLER